MDVIGRGVSIQPSADCAVRSLLCRYRMEKQEGKNKHKVYSLRRRKGAPENLVLEPTPVLKKMNILKKSLMLME